MNVEPVVLEGDVVRLEPMRLDHLPALCEAGLHEELWKWTTANILSREDMERYVRTALADQAAGTTLPFVTIEKDSGKIVGSTRFGNIDRGHRRAEIGWTWVTPEFQRTAVNTEAKLLMLTHAFEVWKCVRIELKTDSNNQRSRTAITRIGSVEEGTLRNHMITETGRLRHSVYFSIIDTEWESVKAALASKLAARK